MASLVDVVQLCGRDKLTGTGHKPVCMRSCKHGFLTNVLWNVGGAGAALEGQASHSRTSGCTKVLRTPKWARHVCWLVALGNVLGPAWAAAPTNTGPASPPATLITFHNVILPDPTR